LRISARILFLLPLCVLAHADTVYLKNGKALEGEVIKEDADGVVLKLPSGEIKLKAAEVEAVERQTTLEYKIGLGRRMLQAERYDAAVAAFQDAYLSNKDSVEAKRMLCTVFWTMGKRFGELNRIVEARSALENLLKLDPDAKLIPHNAAQMLAEFKAYDEKLDSLIAQARGMAAAGDWNNALQLFDQILNAAPDARAQIADDMAQCHVKRATLFSEAGNLLNAAGDLEAAMRLNPKLGDSLERLYCSCTLPNILTNLARGDIAQAQTDLKRALEFCPNSKFVLYVAGRTEEALGRIPNAANYYAQALGTRVANATPAYLAELRQKLEVVVHATGNKLTIDTSASELTGFATSSSGPAQKYETENFTIYHYNEALAREAGNRAETDRTRILNFLGMLPWRGKAKIYLHRTHAEYTAKTGLPEWTGGVTRASKNGGPHLTQIDIHSWQTSPRLLTSTLPHEITHVVVSENVSDITLFPRCLNEGFAILMEPQYHKEYYLSFLRMRLKSQDFIPLGELLVTKDYPKDPDFFYAEGYCLVEFLLQTRGMQATAGLVKNAEGAGKIMPELLRITGYTSIDEMEKNWKGWLMATKETANKK
jgi:tetratricopeptide (TPR) repeat protein